MIKQNSWPAAAAVLLMAGQLSACGYGWQRTSNQYPPSSANVDLRNSSRISSPLRADEYVVQPGDSLSQIAQRKGMAVQDLAGWNNLNQNYSIVPGQLLRLSPPTYVNPVSAASGSVAYPPSEASSSEAIAVSARPPLQRPVAIAGSSASPAPVPVPKPLPQSAVPVPPAPPVSVNGSANGVGYSVIAPSAGAPALATPPRPATTAPAAPVRPAAPAAPAAPASPASPVSPPAATLPRVPEATRRAAPTSRNASAVSAQGWRWPVQGTVVKSYAPANGSKGVDVSVDLGTPVRASAAGRVAYSGSALKGYGELIVIKHDEVYLTAYGYNRKRLVKEGEQVQAGQIIAESGIGPEQNTVLHFEIRENGNPVDPLPLLPPQ